MNIQHPYYLLAAEAYGAGTYACGNYEQGCATVSTGSSSGAGNGGLSYTGYNIIIPVALGIALVIAAAILLVTRSMRRRKAVSSH